MKIKHKYQLKIVRKLLNQLPLIAPVEQQIFRTRIGNQVANLIVHFNFCDLSPHQRKLYLNGMGPKGWKGIVVPNYWNGLSVRLAGDSHDWDFTIGPFTMGGSGLDWYFNLIFLNNCLALCESRYRYDCHLAKKRYGWWKWLTRQSRKVASEDFRERIFLCLAYYRFVNKYGREHYGGRDAERVHLRYTEAIAGIRKFNQV